MSMVADALYDEDFYAWTQRQAGIAARARAPGNRLDLEHIA